MTPMKSVGQSVPRVDALERVTGRATYTNDYRLPGMLYARVLRSPHPHAKIRKVDISAAKAMPGVKAILTRDNCDVVWSSGDTRNKRYLFNNPVRFAGDAVAAVAAVNRHVAEEALKRIAVEYEVLPFVLEPEAALKPDAPKIHDTGNLSPNGRNEPKPDLTVRGNIDAGLKAADHVFEGEFSSPHINNAQLEPRVAIGLWEGEKLTVYASTQGIANCRTDIAKDLGLPVENVRVICRYMGGGFGNKNQCHDFDLMAAVLAKQAGAPVKLEFTRREDFLSVHGRWPTKQYYRVGVKNDGSLTAIDFRGFAGMGPYRKSSGDISGTEAYACANVSKSVSPVYTNMAVSANLRGPAYPQGYFGIESIMDDVAYSLKMDPVEFRLKNMTRKFRDQIPYTSYGLEKCIREGAAKFGWNTRWRPQPASDTGAVKRGAGMGMGIFGSALGRSSARLVLDNTGKFHLYVGVTDIGTAAKTTMGLIAAEELGAPLSQIEVVNGDTATCPYSVGESGSRTTTHTGVAVIDACKQMKARVAKDGPPKDVYDINTTTDPRIEGNPARYSFVAHFAEVEVDTQTGHVKVTRFVAAHDSGRVVNPLTAESQVKGGTMMGIGMALHEELRYDRRTGLAVNPGFYGARIATHMDAPNVEVLFVDVEDAYGPFGAKTLGELTIIPTPAAIGNAIYNAIGVRMRDLPITREKILDALAKQNSAKGARA